jgi:hypothetical protein
MWNKRKQGNDFLSFFLQGREQRTEGSPKALFAFLSVFALSSLLNLSSL